MNTRRPGPRLAVIGTCTSGGPAWSPDGSPDSHQLLTDGLEMVDRMARQAEENGWSLDLVVLPEGFSQVPDRMRHK